MNNQDYQTSFQGNGENNLNFPQHTFPMTDNYFGNVNAQKATNDILHVPNPLDQNVNFGSNVSNNFNNANQLGQPYFSEFPSQMSSPAPYPGSFQAQEEQFTCEVSQPQVFPDQAPLVGFSSDMYSNAQCSNNPQSTSNSMSNFPTTSEYMNCDPKSLYPSMVLENVDSTNLFPTSNGSTEANTSAFPLGNGNHLYSSDAPILSESLPPPQVSESIVSASTSHAEMACQDLAEAPSNAESGVSASTSHAEMPCQNLDEAAANAESVVSESTSCLEVPCQNLDEASANTESIVSASTSGAEILSQDLDEALASAEMDEQDNFFATPAETAPGNVDINDPLEDEISTQSKDDSTSCETSEKPTSQSENDCLPHSNSDELPSQRDSIDVPHTSSEDFPSLQDEVPHSNSDDSACQPPSDVPHSSNEVDASDQYDKVESESGKDTNQPDGLGAIENPKDADVDQSVECGSTMETLDDLSYSLEKGIEASLEESSKEANEGEADAQRPMSPMITALDGEFLVEPKKEAPEENVRVTRTRTGALRKTQRYVDEAFSEDTSQDKILYDEWTYEEGAELAPSVVDSSITIADDVLKVTPKELASYYSLYIDGVDAVLKEHLHCTSCGDHIGASPNFIHIGNRHKVLRVLTCNKCRSFYGVGKFSKDSDGSELFCRWCGQGGQVICCSSCPNVFCQLCITRNLGDDYFITITSANFWACFLCNYELLWPLRARCWALLTYTMRRKKDAINSKDSKKMQELQFDRSTCCSKQTRKRRPPSKPKTSHANFSVAQNDNTNGLHFSHFLFDGEDSASTVGAENNSGDDDGYIDPSQFVQSVLEEPARVQSRILPKASSSRVGPQASARPSQTMVRPGQMPPQLRPIFRLQTQGGPRTLTPVPVPRLYLRQGNIMQPGLLPINSQPNSILMQRPGRAGGPSILRNSAPIRQARPMVRTDMSAGLQSPSTMRNPVRNPASIHNQQVRNPASVLNQIDGVRSMEQLQALDLVPWYRDGIDNVRAVGFALNKRIRELEARFHSLKNKQDIEKVMILGRKLERLSEKTEKRFNQINASLKNACRNWCIQKLKNSPTSVDPFKLGVEEGNSDWDDELELSKPLEKVLIPVNSVALQAGPMRQTQTRVISRTTPPPLAALAGTGAGTGAGPSRAQTTVATQRTVAGVGYTRLPGPKSSVSRFMPVGDLSKRVATQSFTQAVGALINKKNGPNSISISLAPAPAQKRKRLDSGSSSSSSDVLVCHTIPELVKMHNVKPCSVRIEKDDDFISSFLERQEQARSQRTISLGNIYGEFVSPEALMSDPVSSSSEFSEHFLTPLVEMGSTPEKQPDTTNSKTMNNAECPVDDDDDDIEIIDEVSKPN